MHIGQSPPLRPAPPHIVRLADRHKDGFQTHIHVLASARGIVSEEHRQGIIAECNAQIRNISRQHGFTGGQLAEINKLLIWARMAQRP